MASLPLSDPPSYRSRGLGPQPEQCLLDLISVCHLALSSLLPTLPQLLGSCHLPLNQEPRNSKDLSAAASSMLYAFWNQALEKGWAPLLKAVGPLQILPSPAQSKPPPPSHAKILPGHRRLDGTTPGLVDFVHPGNVFGRGLPRCQVSLCSVGSAQSFCYLVQSKVRPVKLCT